MAGSYLVVLGDRDAIVWVLREQRMAFPEKARAEAKEVTKGDRLFLYATRGAWNNTRRDRGRIIGLANVTGTVHAVDPPIKIGARSFHSDLALNIQGVIPFPGGLEILPLLGELATFPKPHAWSAYLRRPLLGIADSDVEQLTHRLEPLLTPRRHAIATYRGSPVPAIAKYRRTAASMRVVYDGPDGWGVVEQETASGP
jgi:hypothetical protein